MRTKFLVLMLMLVTVLSTQAQSLTGKNWNAPLDEDGAVMMTMRFETDGTCGTSINMSQEVSDGITILFMINVPGTYTLSGSSLVINNNKEMGILDFDLDIKGVDESTKEMMKNMLAEQIAKSTPALKDQILESLDDLSELTITSLTSTSLVMVDSTGEEKAFSAN